MSKSNVVLNGRYELLGKAGSGGMSTVYKGRDQMLGRLVAIKMLHESLTNDEQFLHRFQKEAHAAANLTHPNIVTVHDIGQDQRRYYIVMEYVEGWTLKEVIRQHFNLKNLPLSIDRSLDIAIQICSGIGYAHRANLVHCDVKSQNILVAQDGRIKVTDFGIARALSESSLLYDVDVVWGTPQYFSPEQAAGERPTPASDVYSIGVIMFEMLTAQLPFQAENHTALALKHIQDQPPHVDQLNPSVPDQLDRIVDKVLAKEPAGRYRTADQLGRVLKVYRDNSEELTGPVDIPAIRSEDLTGAATVFVSPTTINSEPNEVEILDSNSENAWEPASSLAATTIHIGAPEEQNATDWTAIILGIIALISLLGLIPLWYLVFTRYTG
jgi:serine/threonine-protein kinase